MKVLIMGHKPSSNIAIIALRETTNLRDFPKKYPKPHRAINEDSFVDNIFILQDTMEDAMEGIKQVEEVSAYGGFKYKEWTTSGQKTKPENAIITLIAADPEEDEKALGLGWKVKEDLIYSNSGVNFSKKREKLELDPT